MPIDSVRKRKAAAWITGIIPPSIHPDGSFDQGDRQTIGWGYYGILAGASLAITPEGIAFNLYQVRARSLINYMVKAIGLDRYITKSRSKDLER